jgi:hypothetical protein
MFGREVEGWNKSRNRGGWKRVGRCLEEGWKRVRRGSKGSGEGWKSWMRS